MSKGRRVARQHNYKPLFTGFVIAAVILMTITIANIVSRPATSAAPTPQPTATWTTYIPETPQACRDMVDAADAMYDQANKYGDTTLDAASKAAKQQFTQAERAIDKAQAEQKKLAATQKTYLAQAKKCANT